MDIQADQTEMNISEEHTENRHTFRNKIRIF